MRHKFAKLLLALGLLTGAALGGGIVSPSNASALGGIDCSDHCSDSSCTCIIHCHSTAGGGCACAQNACLPPP